MDASMTETSDRTEVAIIGAGIIGIAVAYYLVVRHAVRRVVLLDAGDPMALTSAQSGENYRNWWPHPLMTAFTDDSIGLMEEIARASGNCIRMTRRGYALATRRADATDLLGDLFRGYGSGAARRIRVHEGPGAAGYRPAASADWETAPDGVDVLLDRGLIQTNFPSFAHDITTVIHIRRAGDISGQQLGQFMLEAVREAGGRVRRGRLRAIEGTAPFVMRLDTPDGPASLRADRLVNAAGPYVAEVDGMLDERLPVACVFQQKIAFEDRGAAIPRAMPFAIDLDEQQIPWSEEERAILAGEPEAASLLATMPGGIHCRPDGGDSGTWIKLGWAYNRTPSAPCDDPPLDPQFPDTVLRGASRLNPALRGYIGRLPRNARHYGGYYTMTPENWPLIGPMRTPGAFVAGALSGFGTMAACATGALCAGWVAGGARPPYADALSPARHEDRALMAELAALTSQGVL
jgi:glycine/D-amino acid oxidase-like deaminating enzyme